MPTFCLPWTPNAAAQPRLKAGAQRTLEAVGCSRLLDRGLGGLDPLEPLFELLHHCHDPRWNEPFVTQGGIKTHASTHHQHEGLSLTSKRHIGGDGIGGRAYVGFVTFHDNIPRPAKRSWERKPIPERITWRQE